MTTPATAELRKTALHAVHRRLGAKMVNFGGWDMPLEYSGILSEHEAVRTRAGLFDVSHMGEIEIRGPAALDLVQRVTCNNAAKLAVGQAQYSGLMTDTGHVCRRFARAQNFRHALFLCVNAGNQDQRFRSHRSRITRGTRRSKMPGRAIRSSPFRARARRKFCSASPPVPLDPIRYYHFTFGTVDGVDCLIARTGYTGEDGFEIYFAPEFSEKLWNDSAGSGQAVGMIPCGLGARNTLRLEAAMCLYGHEIDETTTPWEAGLGWICKLEKGEFLGRECCSRAETSRRRAQARRI